MKVVDWISAARPATLWAGVVPVAVGSSMAWADAAFSVPVFFAALGVSLGLQLASNFVNDVADGQRGVDGPDRLGPARALATGKLTGGQLWVATLLSIAAATACGLYLVSITGWPLLAAGLASIASAILYTAGPMPLGYIGLGDAMVLVFFGLVAVCGTYFAHTGTISVPSVAAAVAIGALATAILAVNNLRDREADARHGKKTLVARFGPRFGRIEYSVLVAISFGAVGLVALSGQPGWWLTFLALPVALSTTRKIWVTDGRALNPLLGATAKLELIFGTLLCVGAVL